MSDTPSDDYPTEKPYRRPHRATGRKAPGGARPGAGRPEGTSNALPIGYVKALKGLRLYAPRDRLPALPEDEFYHADLIGLAVFDAGGAEVGRIKAVHDHGAGDLLEVARPGKPEALVPFTRLAHALVAPVEYLWRLPQVVIWRRPRPAAPGGSR